MEINCNICECVCDIQEANDGYGSCEETIEVARTIIRLY